MYPSKGSGSYGQQQYSGQQTYGQIPGTGNAGAQHAMASRQSMMGVMQEADVSGYRTQSAQGAQYGGPYASVYGSTALTSAHQVGGVGGKGTTSSGLQGQYSSALSESSKLSAAQGSNLGMNSDDYVSASSRAYAQKGDLFTGVKKSDYSSIDRRQYGDQAAYMGRELQNDPARRYVDSVSISQQHQADMHDHLDQASLLRQQQLLKAQSLQSASDIRQADYLAARATSTHHGSQDYSSYGGRMEVDPRSFPILPNPTYAVQPASSVLVGAPRRNVDDLYSQGSSNAAYGVGLPPGRDYVAGRGLLGQSLESDYRALPRVHPSLGDDVSAYRRELERDEERRRELIREKEKEREREERERRREREREREREKERERERERDRKRALDARRERTPSRSARDHRGSSLLKDEKTPRGISPRRVSPRRASPHRASSRRASPHREASNRHRSPIREKKREYICKVYSNCLVDAERDYSSLNKRYPRLFISPEFTKVVFHWPKQSLHLSLQTPVSFEHEYVELENKDEKALASAGEPSRMKHENTVWNAKVILMSGMSSDALNNMCSYKSSDERIIHFNNILRFAILKKDHSFMAIGGPWNAEIDGGDPSVEDSSLIQTACRYLKNITQLDLQNCQHWNRFLEIHYDRIGEDGLFSHKEITVLFVPDLSECLPSLDAWRSQWLARKEAVAEREQQQAAKNKKSTEKESMHEKVKAEASAGKGAKVAETSTAIPITEKDTATKKAAKNANKESNKKNVADQKRKDQLDDILTENNAEGAAEEGKTDGKKVPDGANAELTVDKPKPLKKKIIKKVIKGKAVGKKKAEVTAEDAVAKLNDKLDVKAEGDKQIKQENTAKEEDTDDMANVRTFTRKKIIKKVPAGKFAQKVENTEDHSTNQLEKKKPEMETESKDEKAIKKEPDEAVVPQQAGVRTTGKKKIIRRVIKRKVSGTEEKIEKIVTAVKEARDEVVVASHKESKGEAMKNVVDKKDESIVGSSNSKDKMIYKESKTLTAEKSNIVEKKEKNEKESKKENKSNKQISELEKGVSKGSDEPEVGKDRDSKKNDNDIKKERKKDERENKSKDIKEPKQKSSKDIKEKGKIEESLQHPGLFLQTTRSKGSKIRSMSLSLDGLLDYNDKDIEESTFELSFFAESLNELLQYQMGCRLLSFLEKLRRRFVIKKNQRKRQRDEKSEKENKASSPSKRSKITEESTVQNESGKSGKEHTADDDHDETMGERGSADEKNEPTTEKKSDDGDDKVEDEGNKSESDNHNDDEEEEEDPEEIIEENPEEIMEEDQEMNDFPLDDGGHKDEITTKTDESKAVPEKVPAEDDNGTKTLSSNNIKPIGDKSNREKKEDDKLSETAKSDSIKESVDKEVLQAFRYFDLNRVGYIKVEDLRCLLHNLGKFISHRDVKELVQSALFESNTARDNRIFYKKLVKLADL